MIHATPRRTRLLKALAVVVLLIAIAPIAIIRLIADASQDRR